MLNRIARALGYELFRKSELRRYPYAKDYEIHGSRFKYWIADETARRWYDTEFDKNLVELEGLKTLIRPNDTVLEFGVHYGFYGCYIASQLQLDGSYVGAELDPKAAMYAQSQLALNDFPGRVRVIDAAGANSDSSVALTSFSNGNSHVGIGGRGREIPAVTGDALASQFGGCSLLKIDVEGYEAHVLEGCKHLLGKYPKIAIEIHATLLGRFSRTVDDVLKYLDLERYSGVMYRRPGLRLEVFNVDRIDRAGVTNLFLKPRVGPNSNG